MAALYTKSYNFKTNIRRNVVRISLAVTLIGLFTERTPTEWAVGDVINIWVFMVPYMSLRYLIEVERLFNYWIGEDIFLFSILFQLII